MIIVFRGRNTAAIRSDALAAGLRGQTIVVCRDGDDMAEAGDVPVSQIVIDGLDDVIIVANGGTTAQLLGALAAVVRVGRLAHLVEVGRGGVIASSCIVPPTTCGCGCGEKALAASMDCARRIAW